MKKKIRIAHYLNQFFGQIGGEEYASEPLSIKEFAVGPGIAFKDAFGPEYEIIVTFICGDNYITENQDKVLEEIIAQIENYKPDIFIAGPAFNAGRYGPACGLICSKISEKFNIPSITGMYEENPGAEMYKKDCYIIKTKNSVSGMRSAVSKMANLGKKLIEGYQLPHPKKDGYLPKGFRKNIFVDRVGAERAIDLLLNKVKGNAYETELILPPFESVDPAKNIPSIASAKVALVTDAGITDKENKSRLESARATKFLEFNIDGMERLSENEFCSVHGGFDTTFANKNPNILLPLDIAREFVKNQKIGSLFEKIYSTTGNGTSIKNAQAFGAEIAKRLKKNHVDAVILTST
jgi:glycine reductase